MPYFDHIHCSQHIRDGNEVVLQRIQLDMNKSDDQRRCDKYCLDRTETDHKEPSTLVVRLDESDDTLGMDHLHSHEHMHMMEYDLQPHIRHWIHKFLDKDHGNVA